MSDEFISLLEKLAAQAISANEPNIAIVIYVLAGALQSGQDGELAALCKGFAKRQIKGHTSSEN